MRDKIKIKVVELIGSSLCISVEDGQKVFDKIYPLIKDKKDVLISFENVSMLISLFLNVAIGQLYGSLQDEEIRSHLDVEGLSADDLDLVKHVVENAKKYYLNKKSYDGAWEENNPNEE